MGRVGNTTAYTVATLVVRTILTILVGGGRVGGLCCLSFLTCK